jgi:GPH family glycoside/pentoside/hexuronide:cation symporter
VSIERQVPIWRKAGYGAGSIADSIYFYSWDLLVLFYFTQVRGLPGTLTGIAILIALVIDAISDPYVGYLSDRLHGTRWGRRNTPVILSAVPLALSFALLFMPPASLGHTGLFLWLLFFGVSSRLLLTLFVIPYKAMGAELSRSVTERPRIVAAAAIGNTIARVGLPLVTFGFFFVESARYERGQLDPANYPPFATAAALAMLASIALVVAATLGPLRDDERREAPATTGSLSLGAALREVLQAMTLTPNVRRLFVLAVFVFVCMVSITVLKIHVLTYLWQVPKDLSKWVMSAQGFGGALGAVLLPLLLREFDRRRAIIIGIGGFTMINALAVLLPVFGVGPATGSRELATWVIAAMFMGGVFLGAYLVSIGAISNDVADEHEVATGTRQQALIAGFLTLAIKAAGGLMSLVTGIYLDLIRFPKGVPAAAVPPESVFALGAFVAAFCVIGAVGVIAACRRIDSSIAKQRDINRRLEAGLKSR